MNNQNESSDSKSEPQTTSIDTNFQNEIMTPEEVAQYLRKSLSWVYKNWKILGARKLGGSLIFPKKEDLYEHIFQKRERMEVRNHPKGNQVYKSLVQDKKSGERSRSNQKGGDKKSKTENNNPNRHGLLGFGKS